MPSPKQDNQGRKVAHLIFELITPDVDYHAGFVSGRVRPHTPQHTHDFFEMFYMLEGAVSHTINGETTKLLAGDLVMVRDWDCHSLSGRRFHLINMAFPAEPWQTYCRLAGLENSAFADAALPLPPTVHIPEAQREECAAVFGRALSTFQRTPQGPEARRALCRFWSTVLDFFAPHDSNTDDHEQKYPSWLSVACRAMYEEDNLRTGLSRFVEISGVTRAHLTRTLQTFRQQSPTEFINEVRLRHAAMLLATTPADILDIASDCGFDNVSYFYRRFRRQFGTSPRAYRKASQCVVMPLQK
jgi:AraC-like DNA-binding protein/mannose-6-phosphate isomerase-like protein (cupin superfamily)